MTPTCQAGVTHRHGALPRDLAASQRRPARLVTPAGRPNGPSAQRLTTRPAPLPTSSCRSPHTINSPIPTKNLTRDTNATTAPTRYTLAPALAPCAIWVIPVRPGALRRPRPLCRIGPH